MAYIGKQPVVGNFVKLDAIVTSATTTFNLLNGGVAYFPQSANNCIVSLNGIIQEPTSSGNAGGYTISGSTIVFTSALTSLDVIDFILVLGDTLSIGIPSDGTVSFAKVTSNLITGATSEATIAGGDSILIFDDSASALRKMTRTNFVAGIGGTNTPNFRATMSSGTSLPDSTFTKLTFNTETYDTDSCYNTTNYRFTPTTSGKYLVIASVNVSSGNATSSTTICSIYKNGSEHSRANIVLSNSTSNPITVSLIELNGSSDYVEAFAYQGTGGTTTTYTGAEQTYFSAFRLL